ELLRVVEARPDVEVLVEVPARSERDPPLVERDVRLLRARLEVRRLRRHALIEQNRRAAEGQRALLVLFFLVLRRLVLRRLGARRPAGRHRRGGAWIRRGRPGGGRGRRRGGGGRLGLGRVVAHRGGGRRLGLSLAALRGGDGRRREQDE